jgi:hypothetical protein
VGNDVYTAPKKLTVVGKRDGKNGGKVAETTTVTFFNKISYLRKPD